MPNSFLGFPVPRAKIAELIEGSAPPKEHAPWHEPDGTDPIVLPADIITDQAVGWDGTKFKGYALAAPGGLDFYDNILLDFNIIIPAEFPTVIYGSGTITWDGYCLNIGSEGAALSGGSLRYEQSYPPIIPSWTKKTKFKSRVRSRVRTDSAGAKSALSTGLIHETGGGFGFQHIPGTLQGISRNGTATTTVDLLTGLGTVSYTWSLEAIFTPGVDIKFYVDGVLKGTITTNLPTSTYDTYRLMEVYCKSVGVYDHDIWISGFKLAQET